jgi:hypothetical protein
MDDPRGELGDFICTAVIACKQHERRLRNEAAERGTTYESLVAAALASAILERWAITPRGHGR